MAAGSVLERAIPVAVTSAAITALVQLENLWLRVAPAEPVARRVALAAEFPFLQWQTVVAAALVGLGCAWVTRRRAGKWGLAIAAAIFATVHALVAFDQTAFRLFGEHMAVSQSDGGWRELAVDVPALFGSALTAGGGWLLVNLAVVAAATWRVTRSLRGTRDVRARKWVLGGLAYVVVAIPATHVVDAEHLDEYPLSRLFSAQPVSIPVTGGRLSRDVLDQLRDSTWRDDSIGASRGFAASGAIHSAYRKPNVVLVVLESVGSEQLLPGDSFSVANTPLLAARAPNALIFPRLYGMYPATTRAHVPLMTGGRTITWGSVSDELTHRSTAATIVSAMRGAGYRTGLFAAPDLRFGSLADFYRTMPWDTVVYYLDGKSPLTKKDEVHTWGVNEDAVRPLAVAWADSAHRTGAPYFLEFHTISTHYPYGTWGGDRGPATADDDHSRYRNSLHYTDAALDRLLGDLERRGLLRNTIVAITGDHGEAFAEYHANNFLHRNALWEENIRNFLVVLTPEVHTGVTVRRLGGHGDVMPTLLSLAGVSASGSGGIEGQDLLSPGYVPRVEYFYKDVAPAQTGLRDGRWKYIARRDGRSAQLFDLTADSTEQHNVAAQHPGRVALYRELAAAWYVQANDDYTSHLVGWDSTGKHRVTRRNIAELSPPELRVGRFTGEPGEGFVPTPVVGPNDRVYVVNRWGFLPGDVPVRIVIVSPSHRVYDEEVMIASDWDTSWYHPPIDRAKETGRWEVSVWRGASRLAKTSFRVAN